MLVAHVAVGVIVAISLLLMLARPYGVAEVWVIGGGALALLLAGLLPWGAAVHAIAVGADVYFFLAGMMLVSELARREGVFAWLAGFAVEASRRSRVRLFTTIYLIGTVVTIFMSNDATAVVLTPAILVAMKRAKVPAMPYLFACALIANAASFVLPISNPANLVVFDGDMPSLGRWLTSLALPSLLSIGSTYCALRWVFRRDLRGALPETDGHEPLSLEGKLVLGGLVAMSTVLLVASALHADLGLPTFVAGVAVTGLVCFVARKNPLRVARGISLETIVLVAALFVLVEALQRIGVVEEVRAALDSASSASLAASVFLVGPIVAVTNNLVNNLPLGLVLGAVLKTARPISLLSNTVLIGVDLGPNLSVTGSLATILWLLALRREKVEVSAVQFLRVGVVAVPVALLAALGGVLLVARVDERVQPGGGANEPRSVAAIHPRRETPATGVTRINPSTNQL